MASSNFEYGIKERALPPPLGGELLITVTSHATALRPYDIVSGWCISANCSILRLVAWQRPLLGTARIVKPRQTTGPPSHLSD